MPQTQDLSYSTKKAVKRTLGKISHGPREISCKKENKKRNYIIKAEEERAEETQEKAASYANHPEEKLNSLKLKMLFKHEKAETCLAICRQEYYSGSEVIVLLLGLSMK